MEETIKSLIQILKETNAGFVSLSFGEYTFIATNDTEGAACLQEAWDNYANS